MVECDGDDDLGDRHTIRKDAVAVADAVEDSIDVDMHAHVRAVEDSNRMVEAHKGHTAVGFDLFYSVAVVDSTPQPWLYVLRAGIVLPLVPKLHCN